MKQLLAGRRGDDHFVEGVSAAINTWLSGNRAAFEWSLWLLVAVTFVLDAHTTTVGLQRGFAESNVVMHAVFARFDVSAIWAVKTVATTFALGCWAVLPRADRVIVPASLGLPWAVATLSNLSLLAPF